MNPEALSNAFANICNYVSECNDIIRLRNVFEEGEKARRREAWGVRYEVRMHMSTCQSSFVYLSFRVCIYVSQSGKTHVSLYIFLKHNR